MRKVGKIIKHNKASFGDAIALQKGDAEPLKCDSCGCTDEWKFTEEGFLVCERCGSRAVLKVDLNDKKRKTNKIVKVNHHSKFTKFTALFAGVAALSGLGLLFNKSSNMLKIVHGVFVSLTLSTPVLSMIDNFVKWIKEEDTEDLEDNKGGIHK